MKNVQTSVLYERLSKAAGYLERLDEVRSSCGDPTLGQVACFGVKSSSTPNGTTRLHRGGVWVGFSAEAWSLAPGSTGATRPALPPAARRAATPDRTRSRRHFPRK